MIFIMKLYAINTGTVFCYEHYHGQFILEDNTVLCTWNYDKRQRKYISMHRSDIYPKGFKKYYADNVEQLKRQLQKIINH